MPDNNKRPKHRLGQLIRKRVSSQPTIEGVVELKKPNMEMHLEPTPTSGAPDVCTGNPLCYCVGVDGCSCDQVCSCDNVCAKDPACSCVGYTCSCVGYTCSCDGHCSCHSECMVCWNYCVCLWNNPPCDCNWVCVGY